MRGRQQFLGVFGSLLMACGAAPTPAPNAQQALASGAPVAASPTPEAAQERAQAGEFEEAAALWQAIALAQPQVAATAEFNALLMLARTDRHRAVQAQAARFVAAYPDDPMRPQAAFVHARASELLFDFEAAIASYLDTAHQGEDRPKAAAALMRASALCMGLGQHLRAASLAQRAVGLDARHTPALLRVAEAYARSGSNSDRWRVAALQALANATGHALASLKARTLLAEGARGDARAAAFEALAAQTAHAKDPEFRRVHARARFEALEPAFQRFAVPFAWPTTHAAQAARLEAFAAEAARLRRAYSALVGPDDVHSALGALWRIGRVFEVFDARLSAIPPPAGLPADKRGPWRATIDALEARGSVAQAIEAWHAIITKAQQLAIRSTWAHAARAALCARDRCPPPAPPEIQVTIPPARPPFEAPAHAMDADIFGQLLMGDPVARSAAIERFEAAPGDRVRRLNRLRAALQTAPELAHALSEWPWVRADPLALDLLAEALMRLDAPMSVRARARAQTPSLLREALRLPDAPAQAYARLAAIEATAGRLADARGLAEEALSRRPDLAEARRLLDQITTRTPVAK